jgi:beta-galactosidase
MNAVRSKDDTRPIGQAFAQWSYDEGTAGLEDYVGLNYNPGLYDSQHASHPTWKLLGSETSSGLRSRGIYNNNNNQCSSYDNNWAGWGQSAADSWRDVTTRDFIAGEFIWTGFDYIGEPTPYEWPSKSSYFGAIDTANFPKDVFYFYQSRWNYDGPTMVHIVPMNWTNWNPGQSVRVLVYSNADSVELFLNGSSLGSRTVDPTDAYLEWSVSFATGTLEAQATVGGTVVTTDEVRTAGTAAGLQLEVDRATITADGRDLAFVEVAVVDAQGVVVPQASNLMDFAIDGPGTIVGVDNGDATNH